MVVSAMACVVVPLALGLGGAPNSRLKPPIWSLPEEHFTGSAGRAQEQRRVTVQASKRRRHRLDVGVNLVEAAEK